MVLQRSYFKDFFAIFEENFVFLEKLTSFSQEND